LIDPAHGFITLMQALGAGDFAFAILMPATMMS
jgi:hypothetical protein